MRSLLAVLPLLATLFCATARPALADAGDGALCRAATGQAERENGVPDQLLTAISRVETGQADPLTGRREAWPWSINVEGTGHSYASKAEAIAAVRQFQGNGARSIDVGCMQINLLQHPDAFSSLEAAFDPATNARYGARFLTTLFGQMGSWPHAVAAYHSQTPGIGESYQWQVLQTWADGDGPMTRAHGAKAVAATPPKSSTVPAVTPVMASSTAPFGGGGMPVSIQHYGTAISRLPPGKNRDLSAYRTMPIAMNTIRVGTARF
jgi:hypothetical protein